MPSRTLKAASRRTAADSTAAVDDFIRKIGDPGKKEIQAIRKSILGVDSTIAEGIKWNAPSFRTSEHFATMNLRLKKGIGVVFHLGAKARVLPPGGIVIDDPGQLLKWLGEDRAIVVFDDLADFNAKKAKLEDVVRQWIVNI